MVTIAKRKNKAVKGGVVGSTREGADAVEK